MKAIDYEGLPGWELVREGLADLDAGRATEAALLVLVGQERLASVGIQANCARVAVREPREHALYKLIEQRAGNEAHSQYNSLIRRLVSFERAVEREFYRDCNGG